MAMTEHHFVLLFKDRVKVIRMLDDRVVYEETLDIVSHHQFGSRNNLTTKLLHAG